MFKSLLALARITEKGKDCSFSSSTVMEAREFYGDKLHTINIQSLPIFCCWASSYSVPMALLMPAELVDATDTLQSGHAQCTYFFLVIHGDGNLHPSPPAESHQMVCLFFTQVWHSAWAREALGAFLTDDPLALERTGWVNDTSISPVQCLSEESGHPQIAQDFGLAEQKHEPDSQSPWFIKLPA